MGGGGDDEVLCNLGCFEICVHEEEEQNSWEEEETTWWEEEEEAVCNGVNFNAVQNFKSCAVLTLACATGVTMIYLT